MVEFKYVVKIDGKKIWEGLNLKAALADIIKKYPKAQVSVAWVDLSGDVLIATIQV